MMLILVSLLLLALVGIVLLYIAASRGLPCTRESLEAEIRGLLRQGYNGGFLLIDVARSDKFLQLSKYIHARGDYGIELGFPCAEWSADYYKRLLAFCDAEEVKYRVIRGRTDDDPLDFAYVDFGKNHVAATEFVQRVLTEILDVPSEAKLYCRLENGTPFDKLVDA